MSPVIDLAALAAREPTPEDLVATADELRRWGFSVTPPHGGVGAYTAESAYTREELNRREARRRADEILAGEIEIPDSRSLAAILDEEPVEVAFRISRLLPIGGRALLYAVKKAGKSTAVANVIRALVDVEPVFGEYAVTPIGGNVALIDDELSPTMLRSWLGDQGIDATHKVRVWSLRGNVASFAITDERVRLAWAAKLRAANTSVLILDCLRPVLDALGLSEDKDAGRFLVAFDALMREASIDEAIVVHHAGWNGDRPRGDSRLVDWPDALWGLRLDDPKDPTSARKFSAYGRDVSEAERRLDFDPITRQLSLGPRNHDGALTAACEIVREVLEAADDELATRNVETAAMRLIGQRTLPITKTTVREALDHLTVTGQLARKPGSRNAKLYSLHESEQEL